MSHWLRLEEMTLSFLVLSISKDRRVNKGSLFARLFTLVYDYSGMSPKEAYRPTGIGEVTKLQESPDYVCHFPHQWGFSLKRGSLRAHERDLREAIRHAVEVKHETDGKVYGGYDYDETLPQKLTFRFFQKAGLLKPLIVFFSGRIDQAVSFTFVDKASVASNGNEDCKHHWLIEMPNGPTSPGRCKHCGQEREFRNSENDDYSWEGSSSIPGQQPIRQLAAAGSAEFD